MSERANPNDLIAFAGPIFDLILRLKAGIVAPSNELRPKIAAMLEDFERRAERYRFSSKIIQVSKFALAAFVDETVLSNNFNLKEEWEKKPFAARTLRRALGGQQVFRKARGDAQADRRDGRRGRNYYVCMLLGFKGRYAVYEKERLLQIMQETANALVKAGKIRPVELSPHWLANDQPEPPKPRKMPTWAKIGALGGLGFAFIIYLVMWVAASKFLQDAMNKLQL
jgi:type VI secretion system protein ImpK